VVFWKYTNEQNVQPIKVNLVVYENDLLQVKSIYPKMQAAFPRIFPLFYWAVNCPASYERTFFSIYTSIGERVCAFWPTTNYKLN
jgi:hypothetical protein